jgi:site-specific DNA recombinase
VVSHGGNECTFARVPLTRFGSGSGRTPTRGRISPNARIKAERDVDHVIVYALSRMNRNRVDDALMLMTLRKLKVSLVSATENIDETPAGQLLHGVLASVNEFRSLADGEDIRYKMGQKARNGGTIGKAPVGYLNVREVYEGREVRTVVVDQERAPFVVMGFELFATGRYTLESLHKALVEAGFRTRATPKRPSKPVSLTTVGDMLRDRYYLGYVEYDGMEYQGRHQPLVSLELFERVQKVLDSHQGSGVRQRTHHHYLKGALWCARCESRFIVQRAKGNGGVYCYFFCRGRQEGVCDQPYVNVRTLEDAVLDHYATVVFTDEFKTAVRERLDDALAQDEGVTRSVRERLTARLSALDSKENNLLDLAADGAMPKEKIKTKIAEIRDERDNVRRDLDKLDAELEVGRQVFMLALDLLDRPQELYRQAGPAIRRMLNQTIFSKLKIDGHSVTADELASPFDAIATAGRAHARPTYQRKDNP